MPSCYRSVICLAQVMVTMTFFPDSSLKHVPWPQWLLLAQGHLKTCDMCVSGRKQDPVARNLCETVSSVAKWLLVLTEHWLIACPVSDQEACSSRDEWSLHEGKVWVSGPWLNNILALVQTRNIPTLTDISRWPMTEPDWNTFKIKRGIQRCLW